MLYAEISSQLQILNKYIESKNYIEIIPSSDNYHPRLNKVVSVYFHPQEEKDGYILNIEHPDQECLSYDEVYNFLEKCKFLYVKDKKSALYYFRLKNFKDLQMLSGEKANTEINNTKYWYYNKYEQYFEINKFIPLVKHYEQCKENFLFFKEVLNKEETEEFTFFNELATYIFFLLENNGLGIVEEDFIEYYNPIHLPFNYNSGILYPYYNLYNTTSRPTAAFNGINLSAIPHKKEYRECIVPTNDEFVEIDFDGYHIRLIANLIDYELTEESAHRQLGKLYFNKENISEQEYKETKQINFQAMYGKTPKEYEHLEFFQKINELVDSLWKQYEDKGYITVPISNKRIGHNEEGMYPKKLFNYYLQALETANNIMVLKRVYNCLKGCKSKVALYTYDSILIDYNQKDKDILNIIKSTISEDNKYPIHLKHSKNLVL